MHKIFPIFLRLSPGHHQPLAAVKRAQCSAAKVNLAALQFAHFGQGGVKEFMSLEIAFCAWGQQSTMLMPFFGKQKHVLLFKI